MVLCLSIGIGGGWLFRSIRNAPQIDARATTPIPPAASAPSPAQQPDLKSVADRQAAPLLQQLKSDPANVDALTGIFRR